MPANSPSGPPRARRLPAWFLLAGSTPAWFLLAGWTPAWLLLAGSSPAWAGSPPGVTVTKGQILLVSGSPALGFFTVTNTSDQAQLMTGWSTPACGALQLEEAGAVSGGIPRLTLPGKDQLALAPGGYHLTCRKPTPALQAGATVPVTITFRDGATLTAPFQVQVGSQTIPR